jgi:ABC-type multidrug transport system permease subunit
MNHGNPDKHDRTEPFQFTLRHMFVFVLLASVYMALNRSMGFLFASLLLGLFVLGAVVVLLRVGNLLVGGFLGAALASGMLVLLGLGMSEPPGLEFFAACLIYPPIGYGIGMLCAADRMFRSW